MTDPSLVKKINNLEKELKSLKEHLSKAIASDTRIHLGRAQTIQLSSDVLTPSAHTHVRIQPESGLSDDLETITATHAGQVLLLFPLTDTTITVKNGTGNIVLGSSGDLVLDENHKSVSVVYSSNLGKWFEIARTEHSGGGTGADSFLELDDTPSSYSSQAGNYVRVNATPDALEFVDLDGVYQPLDEDLTQIAALTRSADQMLYVNSTPEWALTTLTSFARSLLDDSDASTARTTLGLGTMATEAATAYLLLAGRAGGQVAYGGTGSGDDLTLESTSHATKGNILAQLNGGFFGIGQSSPLYILHIGGNSGIDGKVVLESDAGRQFVLGADDSVNFLHFGSLSNHNFAIVVNNTITMNLHTNRGVAFIGTGSTFAPTATISQQAGASADHANVGGILSVQTGAVGNVGTGEDNLMTFSVPANTLAANGDSIWFEASGSYAENGNTKTIKVRFGTSGTTQIVTGGVGSGYSRWVVRGRIIRTGASAQTGYATISVTLGESSVVGVETSLNQTLSGAVTLRITGEGTSNNDIVCNSLVVGWHPSNS